MSDHETLLAYLDDTLDPKARAQVEAQLADDPEALRFVIEQRRMDRALRSALRPEAAKHRVKQSILAAVRASAPEPLKARVLEEVRAPAARRESFSERAMRAVRRWVDLTVQRFNVLAPPRLARYVTVAAAVLALGLGGFLFLRPKAVAPIAIGKFTAVMGAPKVQATGKRITHLASRMTPVCLGDRIATGDADKAELQFNDGTTLGLNFNTTLEIPGLTLQRTNASTLQRPPQVNLLAGHVWAKVQKATNAPQFAVHTPVATAAVKGTEFGLKVRKADNPKPETGNPKRETALVAVLTVKEGAVEFFNSLGKVEATAMTESTAQTDAAPTEPKRLASLKTLRYQMPDGDMFVDMAGTARLSMPAAAEELVFPLGWAGLSVADVKHVRFAQTNKAVKTAGQIRVVRVERASPAERAGVQVGDVITGLEAHAVANAAQVEAAILTRPQAFVTLTVLRAGEPRTVTLATVQPPGLPPMPTQTPGTEARLRAATQLLIEGNTAEAERALARLLGSGANSAAYNNLGVLYETKDELGKAIRNYQQAIQAGPNIALYHYNLGMALKSIGNLDRAAEELQIAIGLAPTWPRARKELGDIFTLLERYNEAVRAADAALALDTSSSTLWASKAWLLVMHHRYAEAREAALKALALEPNYTWALAAFGYASYLLGQWDDAIKMYRSSIDIDPGGLSNYDMLGYAYIGAGQPEEAEKIVQAALEISPVDSAEFHWIASFCDNLGSYYNERGRWNDADKMYRKALEAAYRRFAEADQRQSKLDTAEERLGKAIQLNAQNAKIYGNWAECICQRGDLDRAEQMALQVLKSDSDSPMAKNVLALIRAKQGKLDEAEGIYRQLLATYPDDNRVHNWLARLLADLKTKLDEALALAQRAAQAEPRKPEFLDTLGWVHCRRGELAEAETALKKGIEASGQEILYAVFCWQHLGQVYEKKGERQSAIEAYRKALNLQPYNQEAKAALDRLEK